MGNLGMDRMGSSFDRMGMSGMDMNRGFGGGGQSHMAGGGMSDRGSGSKAGCQIFVRNVSAAPPIWDWSEPPGTFDQI